jgi:hypothetical protein
VTIDTGQFAMNRIEKIFRDQNFFLWLQRGHCTASPAAGLHGRLLRRVLFEIVFE